MDLRFGRAEAGKEIARAGIEAEKAKLDLALQRFQMERQITKEAEDARKAEEDRFKSAKERFGALSAEDKLEAKRAAQIRAKEGIGGLNKAQAKLLGGFLPEIEQKFQRQVADKQGFTGFAGDLGIKESLKRSQQSQEDFAEAFEQSSQKGDETMRKIVETLANTARHLEDMNRQIATINFQQERRND